MSDITPDPGTAAPPADTGTPAPPPVADTGTPPADPFDSGADQFPREYVSKLREEAQGYRQKAQPYDDVFKVYSDDERKVWLDLAKMFNEDPKGAADWMDQIVQNVRAGQQPEVTPPPAAAPPAAPAPTEQFLTASQLEKMLADREVKAEQNRLVAQVENEVKALRLDEAGEIRVMQLAASKTGGDIAKANEMYGAERQAWIDKYLDDKAKDAGTPSPTTPGGIPSGERTIKSMEDAHAAMKARLEAPV